jgi:hypothetical protein
MPSTGRTLTAKNLDGLSPSKSSGPTATGRAPSTLSAANVARITCHHWLVIPI